MAETAQEIAARYGASVAPGVDVRKIDRGVSGIWDQFGNARKCNLSPLARENKRLVAEAMRDGLTTPKEIVDRTGVGDASVRHWMQRISQELSQ